MADLSRTSVEAILEGQHGSGAYVASPTFAAYRFAWIRDGTFVAHAMDAVGEHESAEAFHRFVARAVERHRHKIEALEKTTELSAGEPPDELILHTRYTLDGTEGTEPWSNFQLDGYGFWLSGLAEHVERTGSDAEPYLPAADLVARYLVRLWDRPCWSCWEEHADRRHPTTVAAVGAGLARAARLLEVPELDEAAGRAREAASSMTTLGAMARSEHSTEVDGSALFVLGSFGPFGADDPIREATLDRIETDLAVTDGGVHRNLSDTYYGGGLWIPLAGALAVVSADLGRAERAAEVVAWIEATADERGRLPEQVPHHLLHPQMRNAWVDRWGPVASPLLWSHAMYLLASSAAA